MSNGSRRRLSRGDRRRNEKLAALREIVTRKTAVVSFDLMDRPSSALPLALRI